MRDEKLLYFGKVPFKTAYKWANAKRNASWLIRNSSGGGMSGVVR
jgi:hypothetical protein